MALVCRSPRPHNARSGHLPCERPLTRLYDRAGRPCVAAGTLPSADSCHAVRDDASSLSPCPWPAPSRGTGEASRGQRSYRPCLAARGIQPRPLVEGGLRGRVPARPDGTTPCIGFVSLAPPLRSTLPSAPTSWGRPCAALVLRLHAYLDRGLAPPSLTACTAHTLAVSCWEKAPAFSQSAPVRYRYTVLLSVILSHLAGRCQRTQEHAPADDEYPVHSPRGARTALRLRECAGVRQRIRRVCRATGSL
jgi:hypothetical protein